MSGDTLQIFSEFLGTLILVLLGDGVCAAVNLKKSKAEFNNFFQDYSFNTLLVLRSRAKYN